MVAEAPAAARVVASPRRRRRPRRRQRLHGRTDHVRAPTAARRERAARRRHVGGVDDESPARSARRAGPGRAADSGGRPAGSVARRSPVAIPEFSRAVDVPSMVPPGRGRRTLAPGNLMRPRALCPAFIAVALPFTAPGLSRPGIRRPRPPAPQSERASVTIALKGDAAVDQEPVDGGRWREKPGAPESRFRLWPRFVMGPPPDTNEPQLSLLGVNVDATPDLDGTACCCMNIQFSTVYKPEATRDAAQLRPGVARSEGHRLESGNRHRHAGGRRRDWPHTPSSEGDAPEADDQRGRAKRTCREAEASPALLLASRLSFAARSRPS